ncbi:MAG: NADH-quinone oxidoreductase subunit C [Acidimicrobiales bacterium]
MADAEDTGPSPATTGDDPEVASASSGEEERSDDGAEYGCPVSHSRGQKVIHVDRDAWLDVAARLLADGWNMCVDLTAVDYLSYSPDRDLPPGVAAQRYEVVASFVSHNRRERIRARAQVPADDPTIASLYQLYPGTDYLEREVFDLLGITFDGHPDMSRILMPETWNGHPLRKDYAVGAIPVQFKAPTE